MKITMLGTGHATVTKCFNTCFLLDGGEADGSSTLLVDGGGGNGILTQLEKAGADLTSLHHLFITHAHTDHLLGCVWVVRVVMQRMLDGRYDGLFHVWSHDKCLHVLREICAMTLHREYNALFGERIILHELHDGDFFDIGRLRLQCFDIHSTKEKQFGFSLYSRSSDNYSRSPLPAPRSSDIDNSRSPLPAPRSSNIDYSRSPLLAPRSSNIILSCLGDEPFNEACRPYVEGADWLLCEAFCLYRDRDIFDPYGKYHSTARDAGRLAKDLFVNHLLLYHTEDRHLSTRRADYTAEAAESFPGTIVVPDDLETIFL